MEYKEISDIVKEVSQIVYHFLAVKSVVNVKTICYKKNEVVIRIELDSITFSRFEKVYKMLTSSELKKEVVSKKVFVATGEYQKFYFCYHSSVNIDKTSIVSKEYKISKSTEFNSTQFMKQLQAQVLAELIARPVKVDLEKQLKIG
jgi:hypothetical protein